MGEALTLFRQVYYQHHSVEEGIVELKRKGFSQMDTVRVLMEINAISVVEADEIVCNSAAWKDWTF
jgi:hypothetical protein